LFSLEENNLSAMPMKPGFKRVPAIDTCFSILKLLAASKDPSGICDISKALTYNRSTVFHIAYTLVDLGILERRDHKSYHFGIQFCASSRAAARRFDPINAIPPWLGGINRKTRLMVFPGIRSGLRAIILDTIDSTFDIKAMSEVGLRSLCLQEPGGKHCSRICPMPRWIKSLQGTN
jgi:IclR family KDG regulon transcriptional repressor